MSIADRVLVRMLLRRIVQTFAAGKKSLLSLAHFVAGRANLRSSHYKRIAFTLATAWRKFTR